jgi:DNA-binding NarL/FixJ family response regulator
MSVSMLIREEAKPQPFGQVGVLVYHEHFVVQGGLRLLVAQEPWGGRCLAAYSVDEACALAARYEPGLFIVDLDLGVHAALRAVSRVREVWPGARPVALAGLHTLSRAAAHSHGIVGVIPRSAGARQLAEDLARVVMGELVFSAPEARGAVRLSNRERDVLGLIAGGATNREIAHQLRLAPDTVKHHTRGLYRKLSVRNRTEAAWRGQELGLTVMPDPSA